jgi:predicted acetyltransferase
MREFVDEGRDEDRGRLAQHATFASFVHELDDWRHGRALPPGWIPGTTLWLVDDDRFIAKVELRHRLTEALRLRGGHVGYAVRPTARRCGYGRAALALALPHCLALGLDRILVTCDETNEASRRIIEANGGTLQDLVQLDGRASPTMRYWIDVRAQLGSRTGPRRGT